MSSAQALPAEFRAGARRRATLTGILLLAAAASHPVRVHAEDAAPSQPYSAAETRLFLTDHLKNLPPRATTLTYRFAKTGNLEAGFDDKVTVAVGAPDAKAGGARTAKLDFLAGEHKTELPPIDAATGNPVVLGFLEHDVREMKRLTGGSVVYFNRRLRTVMAATNEIKPITVSWAGKDIKADEITLDPYKNDPVRAKFTRFANKIYTFVLSDQVPGGIYSMKTVMREDSNTGKTMIEENMTLTESK